MREEQSVKEYNKAPLKRTITGGVVGATIGYLATSENSKKLIARINDTEWKEKGKNLGKATKGKVSELKEAGKQKTQNAYQRVKDSTVFTDDQNEQEESNDDVTTELVNEESYLELKEENKVLRERLQDLEEKLNQISSARENNTTAKKQSSQRSNSTKKPRNKTTNKNSKKAEETEPTDTAVSNNDDTKSDEKEE
ncbi:hypothetical protein GI584_23150 [Gracilibacillus salitolerans]|uniref:Uncharacterized protein n=1 Tax=Gracilibacillus salitolerans TaxID=2663022 RepID=A0A5Q2TRC0_9BACI|nr:YtxH domain-containing protein [Gracilibacillus salitolerans]QGH36771.1 hypothetical protein GI584_23150 [Gracilibacillus salitolerans]